MSNPFRNAAKNPNCKRDDKVWCWYCGTALAQKSNVKRHHELAVQNRDPKHKDHKEPGWYIKGINSMFPQAHEPYVIGFSDEIAEKTVEATEGRDDEKETVEETMEETE